MKQDTNDIDRIIQENLELNKLTPDFTDKLMQKININELVEKSTLKLVLQKNALHEAPVRFTEKLLSNMEQKQKVFTYQPVISKKTLRLVAVFVFGIGVYAFFFAHPESSSDVWSTYIEKLSTISLHMPKLLTSHLFAMSIFALSSLLFIDYQLKNKSQS